MDFYQGPIPSVDKRIWNEVLEKELKGDLFVKKVCILCFKYSQVSCHYRRHTFNFYSPFEISLQSNGEKSQLKKAFQRAQEIESSFQVSDKSLSANDNSSWRDYRDAAARHVRKPEGPRDILLKPLTSHQEFGWTCAGSDAFPTKVYAKKSCEETKYASHLAKSVV